MKLPLPRRRAWRAAVYLGALALVAAAVDLLVADARRTIRPGYLTTRIVEPRAADGSIDYATALDRYFARGVTPDNNAAVPLLQALGRGALSTLQPADGVTDALGMPPLPELGDYFVPYEAFARTRPSPPPGGDTGQGAAGEGAVDWTLPDPFAYPTTVAPDVAAWAAANGRALDRIVAATRRPRFFIPVFGGQRTATLVETQLRHAKPLKEAGAALQARALVRLDAGDPAGCADDLLALHRLARLLSQAPTMVERVVGMSMESSAARADAAAAHGGKLPPPRARELLDGLSALGDLPTFLDAIDQSERFLGLDVVQALAKIPPADAGRLYNALRGPGGGGDIPPWAFAFLPIPYERTAREMNQAYDGMLAAARQPTYAGRAAALKLWAAEVDAAAAAGRHPYRDLMSSEWAVALLLPSLGRATVRLEEARARSDLARVALALSAYRAERGAYPPSLADLSPALLREAPADRFADRPLAYAPKADGYALRSVGPNLTDEGGGGDDLAADPPAVAAASSRPATGRTSSGPR